MTDYETEINGKIQQAKNKREERRRKRHLKNALISAVTAVCVFAGAVAIYTGFHNKKPAESRFKADVRESIEGSMSGKTVILHSNDVHGAIDGYAKMAALKEEFESDGAEVILADAGGFSGNGAEGDSFGALNGFMMMRLAGYETATLGDSEFAKGCDKLRHDISGAKLRLVCSNAYKGDRTFITSDYLYTAKTGTQIGFFGLTHPAECEGITFVTGKDMYELAQKEADSLKQRGAKAVVALSHLGADEDPAGCSLDLFRKVKGIDCVLDGHSHYAMTEGDKGELVQSAGEGFAYIGIIVMDSNGTIEDHYLMSTEKMKADEKVQAEAEKYKNHTSVSDISLPEDIATMDSAEADIAEKDAREKAAEASEPEGGKTEGKDADKITDGTTGGIGKAGTDEAGSEIKKTEDMADPAADGISGTEKDTGAQDAKDSESSKASVSANKDDREMADNSGSTKADSPEASETSAAVKAEGQEKDVSETASDTKTEGQEKDAAETSATAKAESLDTAETSGNTKPESQKTSENEADTGTEKQESNETPVQSEEDLSSVKDGKYEVVKGDCLWNIAKKHLGDGSRWGEIYELNKGIISNPNLIYVGQQLVMPPG